MPILPNSTLGVLGSGQLGRMFAIEARKMGYRVATFSPDTDTPTGQVADVEISAAYEDLDAVRAFARSVNVVTFEFENVPAATADAVAQIVPVRPAGGVLHVTQNRLREKTFLADHGFPVTPFAVVRSAEDLARAAQSLGLPAVLKTAGFGYDGKGQIKLAPNADLAAAWRSLNSPEAILEAFVDFSCEVSVVAARSLSGVAGDRFAHWGVIENAHRDHILDISVSPARVPDRVRSDAIDIARNVLDALDVVGVLCVEFFLTRDAKLLINELAPRPHNSGHLTFDAHLTSQFAQQVRAVCGLPLGSTKQLAPAAAMANLLGDLWTHGEPNWPAALAFPNVKLHLYGKQSARPARKMGHLTALADDVDTAIATVTSARDALTRR